jgi:hypothetical protein
MTEVVLTHRFRDPVHHADVRRRLRAIGCLHRLCIAFAAPRSTMPAGGVRISLGADESPDKVHRLRP